MQEAISVPFVAGPRVRSHQMWIPSPPPPSACVHYIWSLHFPFCSKPSWFNKLKPKRAFQRHTSRPISQTSDETFNSRWPIRSLDLKSPILQEIKEGDHLQASSRSRSGWKLPAVLSSTPHRLRHRWKKPCGSQAAACGWVSSCGRRLGRYCCYARKYERVIL